MPINFPKLFVSIFICFLAGLIGSIFTFSAIPTWYAGLVKPWFSPPNFLFAPVWTILYVLMGIALYLIWRKGFQENKTSIKIFFVQLLLNAFWSIVFFGFKQLFNAFIVIIFLWISILACILLFYKIDKKASYLLIPYLAWVSFAGILNYSVWALNG
ncbi:MAG: TspO/MBR family protein [Candidatus Diapherotrites archaeon]|nr:TspO/MBR family protein [Candidatus Diapherotrites archaeon]